jgi:hypothetical protein
VKVHLFKTTKRRHTWELIGRRGGCFNRITCTTCGENRTTAYEPDAEWLQFGCYRISIRNRLRKGDLLIAGGIIGEYLRPNGDGTIRMRTGGRGHGERYLDAGRGRWERWH